MRPTTRPVPCTDPGGPTSPRVRVSAGSYAPPLSPTATAVAKPTLLTVNWKPEPPPPPARIIEAL